MHDLTGFHRNLLFVIFGFEEPHGLAVKDEIEDYYQAENDGRTNSYTVTQQGERELEARLKWEEEYASS
ncbi:PadR family transcriptional regulator [Haloparvum sp. AD34]